jgi:MFS family permease
MKQVTKFYLTSFLKNQTYFTPILIVFLQAQHLSYQQIFWVFTIGSIFSFLIEIPTGIFADLYGKRKSVIISKFGIFLSFVVFGFSSVFWHFVIAQALFVFGNAFRSGTETAYVYDYTIQNEKNGVPQYTEVKGKQKFWARIGESGATALGGVIAAALGYRYVFFIAAIPAFFNFLLAISWEEIKEHHAGAVKIEHTIQHTKKSLCEIWKNKATLMIILNITLFTSVLAASNKFIQPYMTEAGIPIAAFGFVYAAALGLTAFIVRYSYKIEATFGRIRSINTLSLLAAIPLAVIGFRFISIAGVVLFFIVVIIENIRSPIANTEFHKRVLSEQRATQGSILSLAKSGGQAVILPIAGFFAESYSMYTALLVLSGILVVNGILFFLRSRTEKEPTRNCA